MAGRITKSEQQLKGDPRHNDKVLSRFINCVMVDGKKAVATRVIYDALDKIQARMDKEKRENLPEKAIEAFHRAIDNVKPNVEVRSKRVGGANYQVPMPVTQRRRQSLAFRWIITACRSEKGKSMSDRLARELFDAACGEGKAVTVREQTHRMAEANKAFSHFAW
ncbi:MAG: 30S ribosomal protein S7 [Phycisphaerales bacterium]|jgi:small subunit ribosomal protein S7|nr:30S ribosomal protein S7 [Phycisphaerales bacterium]|tara:strand:+ start:819 stop:1313 length:495 start_codon:yes stop_codon:yes gene_type:complete